MIIEIGVGIVCITPLAIHIAKTKNWKFKTKKEIDQFRKHNNFTTNETYVDNDMNLSKALSNFSMKNKEMDNSENVQVKKKTLGKIEQKK